MSVLGSAFIQSFEPLSEISIKLLSFKALFVVAMCTARTLRIAGLLLTGLLGLTASGQKRLP